MLDSIQEIIAMLKTARKKKGLSQRALSKKVGIPQSHISRIERGIVDLQLSSMIQIARALELELVLVSRSHLSVVQALHNPSYTSKSVPAYRLDEEEEDDNDAWKWGHKPQKLDSHL
jgi:HTH-type transcriptional regulator / antitoxin HipB